MANGKWQVADSPYMIGSATVIFNFQLLIFNLFKGGFFMTKKIKKPMSILLSLIMVVSMFVAFPVTAQADQEIEIIIVTPTHDGDFIKTEENTTLGTSVIGAPSSDSSNTTWTGNCQNRECNG